jgi:hypothetical protein
MPKSTDVASMAYTVMSHRGTLDAARHTASERVSHGRIAPCGQAVHVAHRPSSAPLHPLARYRASVHARHGRHRVAAEAGWYAPGAHWAHVDSALLGLNVPGVHGVHSASCVVVQLSPHEKPASQDRHGRHAIAPEAGWYVPPAQDAHAPRFWPVLKVPGPHARHPLSSGGTQAVAS